MTVSLSVIIVVIIAIITPVWQHNVHTQIVLAFRECILMLRVIDPVISVLAAINMRRIGRVLSAVTGQCRVMML